MAGKRSAVSSDVLFDRATSAGRCRVGCSCPAVPQRRGNRWICRSRPPVRLLDTRAPGSPIGRLAKGSETVVDLRQVGIPAGTTAVVLNLTTVNAAVDGWIRAYPCAALEPETSNVNPTVGQVATNGATIGIGDGRICFRTAEAVDLVVDLNGWLTTASSVGLRPVASRRLVDTRVGLGGNTLTAGSLLEVSVVAANSPATAVAINLTAVNPSVGGFITAWPCGIPRPDVSNLNPEPGVTRPNFVQVRVGLGGKICLYSTAHTDLLVDLFAEFQPGVPTRYATLVPQRLLDSRSQDRLRHQSNLASVLAMGSIVAAQANVTAVNAVEPGYLTAYPCLDNLWPGTSNVNFVAGLASANSSLVGNSRGYACVFASTRTELVFDLFGVWTSL